MWKYLVALLVILFSMGGLVSAQLECADCYANIVTQEDHQTIDTVRLAGEVFDNVGLDTNVAVGNEGLSAGIIVTQAPVNPTTEDQFFVPAPFARIDQYMDQTVSNLGTAGVTERDGAKGVTWNKAIQAAWVANQGVKEFDGEGIEDAEYVKEGSYVSQSTTQLIDTVYDFDSKEDGKVLNVDNKLAMIVDNLNAVIDLTATANAEAHDTQSSTGEIDNTVDVDVSGSAVSEEEEES
jgi:hypothetical protein